MFDVRKVEGRGGHSLHAPSFRMISLQFDQINPADSAKDDIFVRAQFEESLVKLQAPVKNA